MNCHESEEQISALYDGEPVPAEFADHLDACPHCRESLRAYSEIGAQLRLLASRASHAPIPPFPSPTRMNRVLSVTGKMRIPKLAVAAAAAVFIVMGFDLLHVHAQQQPNRLWFQFSLTPKDRDDSGPQSLAQDGFDQAMGGGYAAPNVFFGTHVKVFRVLEDHVELSIRARLYFKKSADERMPIDSDLKDLKGHSLTYYPGKQLEIPLEGSSDTLILEGEILDHKPKVFGLGIPLEPNPDQLIFTNPVLISGDRVFANQQGASTFQEGNDRIAVLFAPGVGLLRFALQPFPGAVEAQANWGNLNFKLNGKQYTLLTATQICGGDQPRRVWVSNNAKFKWSEAPHGFVSGEKMGDPRW